MVFPVSSAGGSSGDVTLFDLRMSDAASNKVIQRYRPSGINTESVSVSGLDISKDKRELLVSYENDQVNNVQLSSSSSRNGPFTQTISLPGVHLETHLRYTLSRFFRRLVRVVPLWKKSMHTLRRRVVA